MALYVKSLAPLQKSMDLASWCGQQQDSINFLQWILQAGVGRMVLVLSVHGLLMFDGFDEALEKEESVNSESSVTPDNVP